MLPHFIFLKNKVVPKLRRHFGSAQGHARRGLYGGVLAVNGGNVAPLGGVKTTAMSPLAYLAPHPGFEAKYPV